jgi:hypothetical protein
VSHWLFGPAGQARLTAIHCVHAAAETFFTVAMAGSIFFSVSPDAARPRVLLFLMLTLAPFLVLAPLVGPAIDRIRGGLPVVLLATFLIRALLAVLLAGQLRTPLIFPLAFGVLVVAKTYTVARNALVPALVDDQQDLVAANARLSRTATLAGAMAATAAVGVYSLTSAEVTLGAAAALYLVGAVASWHLRRWVPPLETVDQVAVAELVRPDVSGAIIDMMVLRAAVGFTIFQFGFSLRADAAPTWMIGALLLANSSGGFTGTVVSPGLRARFSERSMFTMALVAPAIATAVAGFVFTRISLLVAVFILGLAASVGRRALDATIQQQAPHARRGQVYAGLETRLELAWVAGACLAVAIRVATWVGVMALAAFLAVVAIAHVRRSHVVRVLRPLAVASLADRLLVRAETLMDLGYFDEAVVVARAAGATAARDGPVQAADPVFAREQALEAIAAARHEIEERTRHPSG